MPKKEKGNVSANSSCFSHQRLAPQMQIKHIVEGEQDRGRVGRPAAETGRHGDLLFNADFHAEPLSGQPQHAFGCSRGDIFLTGTKGKPWTNNPHPRLIRKADFNPVTEGDPLHDHPQVVVTIRPTSTHVQTDIYFGRSLKNITCHRYSPFTIAHKALIQNTVP